MNDLMYIFKENSDCFDVKTMMWKKNKNWIQSEERKWQKGNSKIGKDKVEFFAKNHVTDRYIDVGKYTRKVNSTACLYLNGMRS